MQITRRRLSTRSSIYINPSSLSRFIGTFGLCRRSTLFPFEDLPFPARVTAFSVQRGYNIGHSFGRVKGTMLGILKYLCLLLLEFPNMFDAEGTLDEKCLTTGFG